MSVLEEAFVEVEFLTRIIDERRFHTAAVLEQGYILVSHGFGNLHDKAVKYPFIISSRILLCVQCKRSRNSKRTNPYH
jgi:hypothetical protein